jgi:hypothetical protein
MNQKEKSPLILDAGAITEITAKEYDVRVVNSIAARYKPYRQASKAP